MGLSLAVFFGPFEGCHGDLPGNTMKERLAYASKQTVKCTWQRAKTLGGVGTKLWCDPYSFLSAGNCYLAKLRGKDDKWNSTISGAVAGAAWGGISCRSLPFRGESAWRE